MKGILLIEDTDSDAELIQRALRLAGIANPLHRIPDGAEAMDYLRGAESAVAKHSDVPSILFLDLKLPRVSGFEILEWIQGRKVFEKTLKIVFSQVEDFQSIKRAYAAGAQSYLAKPLHQSEINDLVASFPRYWLFSSDPGTNSPERHRGNSFSRAPDDLPRDPRI